MKLKHFLFDRWVEGNGVGRLLYDATSGEEIAAVPDEEHDFEAIFHHARSIGNRNLRAMTIHERGNMLKALALYLNTKKELFCDISYATGATRADSSVDIEGGINALFSYATLSRRMPDKTYYSYTNDNNASPKKGAFPQCHLLIPREGVAIHINPFSLPVWNMLSKAAANWLAGMPAVIKPATPTSFLSLALVREIVASGILPKGALQVICGPASGILDHVQEQDVVTFTGAAETGLRLKAHPCILNRSVPFLTGFDALNACVLGPDAGAGTAEFDLFIHKAIREMTSHSGQRCAAIRRLIVPRQHLEAAQAHLVNALKTIVAGNPRSSDVQLGPLVSRCQVEEVSSQVDLLAAQTSIAYQGTQNRDTRNGAFFAPMLMLNEQPLQATATHRIEAFGPVCTLMPYGDIDEAIAITRSGKGSACTSVMTREDEFARYFALATAAEHTRLMVMNRETAKRNDEYSSLPPSFFHNGTALPGEEPGMQDLSVFMQRSTVRASTDIMTSLTHVYQAGGRQTVKDIHLFRKHFEELEIGDTLVTRKRTITAADISNFANLSWDHFYAHTDITALEGSMFRDLVAHGYLVLSAAAGLFVDSSKGPVLLNYGLEDCRFTKPVYAGTTIGVRLTVKEKLEQEKKQEKEMGKGIVKFLVDVYDESGDTVAIATILTLVKKLEQQPA